LGLRLDLTEDPVRIPVGGFRASTPKCSKRVQNGAGRTPTSPIRPWISPRNRSKGALVQSRSASDLGEGASHNMVYVTYPLPILYLSSSSPPSILVRPDLYRPDLYHPLISLDGTPGDPL